MKMRLAGALMVGLGFYLLWLLLSGSMLFYINSRFLLLEWLGVILLFLVGTALALNRGHTHSHGDNAHTLAASGLIIVAVPLALGMLFPPRALGVTALANRSIEFAQTGGESGLVSVPSPNVESQRTIFDWLNAFSVTDWTQFKGQHVDVVGFVYRDDRFAEDSFMVSRFLVRCCIADASAVGLIVHAPDMPPVPTEQWVHVQGTFVGGTFDGTETPMIRAEKITQVPVPAQPYLEP